MKNRFSRGSAVYQCSDCGKQTRDTAGEGSSGLCRTCYEAAELYNSYQDNEISPDEYVAELKRMGYKGSDVAL